jgi:hypothetical protein
VLDVHACISFRHKIFLNGILLSFLPHGQLEVLTRSRESPRYWNRNQRPTHMKFPLTLLGLAAQAPLQTPPLHTSSKKMAMPEFAFKEGSDIFSPKNLVSIQLAITTPEGRN